MITPLEAYATTDGRLFTDPLEAQAHQHGINIFEEVSIYLELEPPNFFSTHNYSERRAIIDWEVDKKLKELKNDTNKQTTLC